MTKHAHYGPRYDSIDTTEVITLVHDHDDPHIDSDDDHDAFDFISYTVVCDEVCAPEVGLTVEALNTVLEWLTEYGLKAAELFLDSKDNGDTVGAEIALAMATATLRAVAVIVEYASVEVDLDAITDRFRNG